MREAGFTEYAAYMRLDGDRWTDLKILQRSELALGIQSTGALFGLNVTRTVRVSPDNSESAALFCAKQAITRLNIEAGERLIPMADEGMVLEALCRLVDNERHLLYDGGSFFARIVLSCDDTALYPYPVKNACLTIMLWYDPSEAAQTDLRVRADDSRPCGAWLMRENARRDGFDNALLLDAVYKKYILGLADANIFFRTDGLVVTPCGEDVGNGIMRGCAIELMQDWGIEVVQRRISADELCRLYSDGQLHEMFATSVYSIVSGIVLADLPGCKIELERGKLSKKLFDAVRNIERGTYPAPHEWIRRI